MRKGITAILALQVAICLAQPGWGQNAPAGAPGGRQDGNQRASASAQDASNQKSADGVTGKWTAQVSGRGPRSINPNDTRNNTKGANNARNNNFSATAENTFIFKVEGGKLTGSANLGQAGEGPIEDATINGDEISFSLLIGGRGSSYKGKVSGDTIQFSRHNDMDDYGTPPTTFTATRVK